MSMHEISKIPARTKIASRWPFIVVVLIMSIFSVFSGEADRTAQSVRRVNVDEFAACIGKTNTVLLDVRTPEEYSAGHIKGAVLINYNSQDFEEKISKLDKSKTYLVYCAGGGRSAMACKKMSRLEFTQLIDLATGFSGWHRANKPIEK